MNHRLYSHGVDGKMSYSPAVCENERDPGTEAKSNNRMSVNPFSRFRALPNLGFWVFCKAHARVVLSFVAAVHDRLVARQQHNTFDLSDDLWFV